MSKQLKITYVSKYQGLDLGGWSIMGFQIVGYDQYPTQENAIYLEFPGDKSESDAANDVNDILENVANTLGKITNHEILDIDTNDDE